MHHSYLVDNATFEPEFDLPCIVSTNRLPERVISFSKAVGGKDYRQWVHFYEDDVNFERLWNNTRRYLPILKQYQGVISPDFSLYRDMPVIMQFWNAYRGRAIANYLQKNGVDVIPNIRFGSKDTYEMCCAGIQRHSTIAIGTHGCIKTKKDLEAFMDGFTYVVDAIQPRTIIVYGSKRKVATICEKKGIRVIDFESAYSLSRRKAAR